MYRESYYFMNTVKQISQEELLQKVAEGVSKSAEWKRPLLLLTKDGGDYNFILDRIDEAYHTSCINTDPHYYSFSRVNNQLEIYLNGEVADYHKPDVEVYIYLGGPLAFDETIHRFCVDLLEYEAKPVISMICVSDKNCSVKDIPAWMNEKFDIVMLQY